jgi:hypothetical protein
MVGPVRVLVALVVAVGIAGPAYAELDAAKIERARSSTLTPQFQEDLPGYFDGVGERTGGDGSASAAPKRGDPRMQREGTRTPRERRRVDTREWQEREEGGVGGLFQILMWALLAVGLGLLVFWLASELSKTDKDVQLPADERDAAVAAATAAIIDKPLGDADELAARGEFAEAIHTLLLRTLHELARSAMVRVERSHTSREILARVPLTPEPREALSVLITYVELTHFGDDPANANDYAKCREQFNRFATAFRAGLAIHKSGQPAALAS